MLPGQACCAGLVCIRMTVIYIKMPDVLVRHQIKPCAHSTARLHTRPICDLTLFRCMLAVIFGTQTSMMMIPTLTVWTQPWHTTMPDFLCVLQSCCACFAKNMMMMYQQFPRVRYVSPYGLGLVCFVGGRLLFLITSSLMGCPLPLSPWLPWVFVLKSRDYLEC